CPLARVTSSFPSSEMAAASQRERWERGHLNTIFAVLPRLLCRAVVQRNVGLLVLALDLTVPPLSLLVILLVVLWGIAFIIWLLGSTEMPLVVITATTGAFLLPPSLTWLSCQRDILPSTTIWRVFRY